MEGNDMSLAAWKRVSAFIPDEHRDAVESYAREWAQTATALSRGEASPHTEHILWMSLMELLTEAGLLTEADRKRPKNAKVRTDGDKLLRALHAWGDARISIGRNTL